MHDDAPSPQTPDERWRHWLAAAGERAPLPVPARSADELLEQARRAEQQAAGAGEQGLCAGDLDLLADLACAEAAWHEGRALPPSASVRAAAAEAFAPGAAAAAREGTAPATEVGAPRGREDRVPEARAPEPGRRQRVLRARPAGAVRLRRGLALGGAVLAVALAWAVAGRLAPTPPPALDAVAQAELERAFAASLAVDAAPLSGQVAPFVDARLWRSLEGRAWRGGESLSLAPGSQAGLAPATAPAAPGTAERADVVLAWRPDASMGDAAGLRVHLRGPAGLRVTLPDLGVEGVLPAAAGDEGTTHVDLPLPGGWSQALGGRDLRLAFTWPRPGVPAAGAPAVPALAEARFAGVSLSTWRVAEGG